MKRRALIFVFIVMGLLLFPMSAMAANYTLLDGDEMNFSTGVWTHGLDSSTTSITTTNTDIFYITNGASVTLKGTAVNYIRVIGQGDVTLTLDNVVIDNSAYTAASARMPLSFNGMGNELRLVGDNTLKAGGFAATAGICVNSGADLEINGAGSLLVKGNIFGAGIGAIDNFDSGDITISGGTINAYGGRGASGIGSGTDGVTGSVTITGGTVYAEGDSGGAGIGNSLQTEADGGIITISGDDTVVVAQGGTYAAGIGGGCLATCEQINILGGTVTATGGESAAGIGGGYDDGTVFMNTEINISGGTVTATGGSDGAGIGNGYADQTSPTINITGGNVKATGGSNGAGIGSTHDSTLGAAVNITGGVVEAIGGTNGAGIGSGQDGVCGDILLSGDSVPLVYASAGEGASYDIGYGLNGSGGALTISGTVAVFLENDVCLAPNLTVPHDHKLPSDSLDPLVFDASNTVYGITVDESWTGVAGGYFILCNLSYDANDGGGDVPETTGARHLGTTVTVEDGAGLERLGYNFIGWNTKADGSGDSYDAGDTITLTTEDMVLYAQWESVVHTLNSDDHIQYIYGYPDGTVQPEGSITRAEVATIFYRLMREEYRDEIFTGTNSFSDVTSNLWYNKAVSSMAAGGYVLGYPDGSFSGNLAITRAEFIAIAARFVNAHAGTVSLSDVSEDHWAYDYIATAEYYGWVSGYTDGTFQPDDPITRAEVMTIINRMLARGVDDVGVAATGFTRWPDNPSSAWYYYEVIEATNNHTFTGTRPCEIWSSLTIDGYSYDIDYYERP